MTADDTPRPITLPAITVIQLAELLTELDQFLRSGSTASDALAAYLARRGHPSPGYQASLLIDDVSFTAAHLRDLTGGIDKAAAEYAYLAGYFGEDYQQEPLNPQPGTSCCGDDGHNTPGAEISMEEFPPLVRRARALAQQVGFPLTREEAGPGRPSSCLPGVGRFLAILAAGCAGGRIGEAGTGAGTGAAWIASAMPPGCTLITVEIDQQLAHAVRDLLADDPRIEVTTGDAASILPAQGPFDLLFADSGVRDDTAFATLVGSLRVGGQIVMDDVTPTQALPQDSPSHTDDLKRRFFFRNPQLISTEVVLPDLQNSLLAGTRVR